VGAELPPTYAELFAKIASLREEARNFEELAGVLWRTGPLLCRSLAELFLALGCEVDVLEDGECPGLLVKIEPNRRLIVQPVGDAGAIARRSPAITRLLQDVQEAAEGDRLVLAVNAYASMPIAARTDDLLEPDALRLMQRLGANVVATSTLFGIWKFSLRDRAEARKSLIRLHGQDGGVFR
jgi:hypothetical protein